MDYLALNIVADDGKIDTRICHLDLGSWSGSDNIEHNQIVAPGIRMNKIHLGYIPNHLYILDCLNGNVNLFLGIVNGNTPCAFDVHSFRNYGQSVFV